MSVDELESNFEGGQKVSLTDGGWLVSLSGEESRVVSVGMLSLANHDPLTPDWGWSFPTDLDR